MSFDSFHVRLACAFLALVAYLLLVSHLRFYRIRKQTASFRKRYPNAASLASMSNVDAHEIIKDLQQYDFPLAFEFALAASLYRPYGIPSVSALLSKTKQFANIGVASKRTADTAVLVVDMTQNPPDSDLCCGAISRMNYIHGIYQKSGLLSNDDLLYVLGQLSWLPVNFIQKYEWRDLTELETCAAGTFWKSLGDAMNLSYGKLKSASLDGTTPSGTWKNGAHFLEELWAWSEEYEQTNMTPAMSNYKAAVDTEPLLLYGWPSVFHPLARQALSAVMDTRLREAIMYPEASAAMKITVFGALYVRRFALRYLCLPRFRPHIRVNGNPGPGQLRQRITWAAQPWYVGGSIGRRWGMKGWREWMCGRPVAGDQGIHPEGIKQQDVGPKRFEGKGVREYHTEKGRLMQLGRRGCPF